MLFLSLLTACGVFFSQSFTCALQQAMDIYANWWFVEIYINLKARQSQVHDVMADLYLGMPQFLTEQE